MMVVYHRRPHSRAPFADDVSGHAIPDSEWIAVTVCVRRRRVILVVGGAGHIDVDKSAGRRCVGDDGARAGSCVDGSSGSAPSPCSRLCDQRQEIKYARSTNQVVSPRKTHGIR
jgi:hypothetical protein